MMQEIVIKIETLRQRLLSLILPEILETRIHTMRLKKRCEESTTEFKYNRKKAVTNGKEIYGCCKDKWRGLLTE